jgi:hypothetical protein
MTTRKFTNAAPLLAGLMADSGVHPNPSLNGDYAAMNIPVEFVQELKELFLDDTQAVMEQRETQPELFNDLIVLRNLLRVTGVCSPGGSCVKDGESGGWELATLFGPKVKLVSESVKADIIERFKLDAAKVPTYDMVLNFGGISIPIVEIDADYGIYSTLDLAAASIDPGSMTAFEPASVTFESKLFGQEPNTYSMALATFKVGRKGSKPKTTDVFIAKIGVKKASDNRTDLMPSEQVIDILSSGEFHLLTEIVDIATVGGGGWRYKIVDPYIPFGRMPIVGAYLDNKGKYVNRIVEVEIEDFDGNKKVVALQMNRTAEQNKFSMVEPLFNKSNVIGRKRNKQWAITGGLKYFLVYYGQEVSIENTKDGEVKTYYGKFMLEQLVPGENFEFNRITKSRAAAYLDPTQSFDMREIRKDIVSTVLANVKTPEEATEIDPADMATLLSFSEDDGSGWAYVGVAPETKAEKDDKKADKSPVSDETGEEEEDEDVVVDTKAIVQHTTESEEPDGDDDDDTEYEDGAEEEDEDSAPEAELEPEDDEEDDIEYEDAAELEPEDDEADDIEDEEEEEEPEPVVQKKRKAKRKPVEALI